MKDASSASLFRGRFDHAAQRACFFEVICLSYMLPVRSSSLTHFAPYGDFELQESSLIALRVRAPTQTTPLGGRFFLKNWALSWSSIIATIWRSNTIYFTFFRWCSKFLRTVDIHAFSSKRKNALYSATWSYKCFNSDYKSQQCEKWKKMGLVTKTSPSIFLTKMQMCFPWP